MQPIGWGILSSVVMPGLVPGIHVLACIGKTWMAGTKPGHDGK
jgi:hypothetical protein